MKLSDQSRFAECMELCPIVVVIVDRSLVEIEADDVAPTGASLDRLRGPPGETAAEIEMVSPLRTDSLPLVSKIYWRRSADDAIMDAP